MLAWTSARDVGDADKARLVAIMVVSEDILKHLNGELLLNTDGALVCDSLRSLFGGWVVCEQGMLELVTVLPGKIVQVGIRSDLAATRTTFTTTVTISHNIN